MSACRRGLMLLALLLVVSGIASAQVTTFTFDLDAAQVVGAGSTSTAHGRGFVTLDAASNVLSLRIFHDAASASLVSLEFGATGTTGFSYNIFPGTQSPATLSFTLFSAADAATVLADGAYIQLYDIMGSPIIRGQITNGFAAQVYISEWCHDPVPPAQSVGLDTNLDGVQATTSFQNDDEFVEIVNGTDQVAILDNWTIKDAVGMRHTFPMGTMLQPGEAITVFGGGDLTNFIGQGLQAQTASTFTLGLNNGGGDTISLFDSGAALVHSISYMDATPGDTDGESTVLIPETPTGVQTPSSQTLNNRTHTPGFRTGGIFPWDDAALPQVAYPGNGTHAQIVVGINGNLSVTPTNVHDVVGGDVVQLNFTVAQSSALLNAPFVAVLQPFSTGNPAPASAFPGDAVPTIRYSGGLPTLVLADGLSAPWLPLSPLLGSYTVSGLIPQAYTGTNTSFMILLIVHDPGRNMLDLGNAEAHELRVL